MHASSSRTVTQVTRPLSVLTSFVVLIGLVLMSPAHPASSVEGPVHDIRVMGTGTTTYPSFSPAITRYGIRTTDATNGTLEVLATTSDGAGRVFVDGRPANGPVSLSGLAPGDEVSVIIEDGLGTSARSFVYLPPSFPQVTARVTGTMQDGDTLATLGTNRAETPRYMTVLDRHAVPRFLQRYDGNRHDFKQQADGTYSVSTDTRDSASAPERILRLNDRFEEVSTHRTVGLVDTDFHESIFLPNGHVILMAYEPRNDGSGLIDSIIQEQDPEGRPVFTWSTRDHVDLATERVSQSADYAHLNSISLLDNGDLLASFRNITSVFRIARSNDGDHQVGDVVWRLGGRASDFDFVGDPSGGQCLQHTATPTSSPGQPLRILLFDNGSGGNGLCVDQSDGSTFPRPFSRAVEYELDPAAGTATMVFEHAPTTPDGQRYFGAFTGSAYRMANGNTLIGWGNNIAETAASEVTRAGDVVWSLENVDDGPTNPIANYGSYRFHRAVTRDAFAPTTQVDAPVDGVTYAFGASVTADYQCGDAGGSNLVECDGPVESGASLDTRTPGTHAFTVTSRDGDGNSTSRTVTYTVLPAPVSPVSPSPSVSPPPPVDASAPVGTPSSATPGPGPRADAILAVGKDVVGDDEYGTRQRSRMRLTDRDDVRTARVRVQNDGAAASSFVVAGPRPHRGLRVTATMAGRDVTRALRRGKLRTRSLAPGRSATVRVTVFWTKQRYRVRGRVLEFSSSAGGTSDIVQLRIRAR